MVLTPTDYEEESASLETQRSAYIHGTCHRAVPEPANREAPTPLRPGHHPAASRKLRQPSNYLIVSLALADLSVALAVMPFVSVTDLIGGEWIFGRLFCNVFIAMDVMCCTASIMTLCVISIDR
ncbi:hypothetical protein EK904_003055 [Melospiza melodia maxima]|nr:hypothetical protein EK904_003055 [Melospiza melodia maxima]